LVEVLSRLSNAELAQLMVVAAQRIDPKRASGIRYGGDTL
jgi:hypothetical protein